MCIRDRLEAHDGAHPGGVQPPAEGQEGQLIGGEVGQPRAPDQPAEVGDLEGHRHDWAPDEGGRLADREDPVSGDVDDLHRGPGHRQQHRVDRVVLVDELHPCVVAERRGQHE